MIRGPLFAEPRGRGWYIADAEMREVSCALYISKRAAVVGGGLDTQDEAEFVVDLDRGLTEMMLDAGALDPRRELAADLLGEWGSDLVAEEGGDVFGFDSEDGLPGKLLIEGFEDGWGTEHQIRGVPDLHRSLIDRRACFSVFRQRFNVCGETLE
jgi:hypothetical protein